MLGWCAATQHSACPVKIKKWYHGTVREGRKNVSKVIYTDEYRECDCKCHKDEPEKPVKRRRRKK